MKPSDALAIHRAALRELVARYGLLNPRVFGSALTKTDTEDCEPALSNGGGCVNVSVS